MVAPLALPAAEDRTLVGCTLDVLPGVLHRLAQASVDGSEEPLTLTQVRLLRLLDGGARLTSELALRVGVSASTVSAAVDGLVRRGLVARVPSARDRRTVPLQVTEAGAAAVRAARARQERVLAGLFETLTAAERRALGQGLRALGRALESGPDP